MTERAELTSLVRAMGRADPADASEMLASAALELGGTDVVVYLLDFEQRILQPLPDRAAHDELPHPEEVEASIAGRALLQRRATTVERPDGTRVWVPILEGSDPTGVLAMTLPTADEAVLAACEDLGVLAGFVIATQDRVTDVYGLHRRRKAMTMAAGMQWELLPPLTLTAGRVTVAGMLEPAYEVGGDCFDYALNDPHLDFALMDSIGHGLRSAVVAALAMGCYRHGRREARTLEHIHRTLDSTIAEQCGEESFVTGLIGRLDLDSGTLAWVNAGHPPPLLVRHGRVVGPLAATHALPWGVGDGNCAPESAALEPGDSVVFYTDGVVEARGPRGVDFGVERLADLIGQHASDNLSVSTIVRLVVRAVLEHHGSVLTDDATVLMINWPGPARP